MPNCLSWSNPEGLPKAAVINQERMWMATFMQTMSGVQADDIIYLYLPLYHSAGFLMGLTGAIDQGQRHSKLQTNADYKFSLLSCSLSLNHAV